jgi:hypothetical protein
MRPKTAASNKAKKSVGFSLTGTKIEPPDDYVFSQGQTKASTTHKSEFYVAKAKEFESFKQIPRYSHATLAVIHPPPLKHPKDVWKPPRDLSFDASIVEVQPKRFEPKNIPEALIRPPIDEETLIRIKENAKAKPVEKLGKKMSLGAQKEYKAELKRKQEIQMKIRKADKNFKGFEEEVKKILHRPGEELIIPELGATVEMANFAEKSGKIMRFLYTCFEASTKDYNRLPPNAHVDVANHKVGKSDFVNFIRFFMKDLSETQATDIFMNLTKKL